MNFNFYARKILRKLRYKNHEKDSKFTKLEKRVHSYQSSDCPILSAFLVFEFCSVLGTSTFDTRAPIIGC